MGVCICISDSSNLKQNLKVSVFKILFPREQDYKPICNLHLTWHTIYMYINNQSCHLHLRKASSLTPTNLSLAMRLMSIHDTYFPMTSKHIQVTSGLLD